MVKKLSQFLKEFEDYRINENQNINYDDKLDDIIKKFKEFLTGGLATGFNDFQLPPEISTEREYKEGSGSFSDKRKMIELVVEFLNKHGITNKIVQKSILATIAKESGFTKSREIPYTKTSPERIREVFGKRFSGLSNQQIEELKKNEPTFWERVYGGEWGKKNLGNTSPGDGAKYIGRGFNGITGKKNYQIYSDMLSKAGTNVNLVQNPELLEKSPEVAAEVNALYFLRVLSNPIIKRKYGNSDPNDFKDLGTALKATVNAVAGPGNDIMSGFHRKSYEAAKKKLSSMSQVFDEAINNVNKNKSA